MSEKNECVYRAYMAQDTSGLIPGSEEAIAALPPTLRQVVESYSQKIAQLEQAGFSAEDLTKSEELAAQLDRPICPRATECGLTFFAMMQCAFGETGRITDPDITLPEDCEAAQLQAPLSSDAHTYIAAEHPEDTANG